MKRNEWTFEYTASKLAEAAGVKLAHHQTRLAWWEKKQESVITKIKESGMDVRESLGSGASNVRRGYEARIVVDETMQTDLDECVGKSREHKELVGSYGAWIEVLNASPEARLGLDHQDWKFFFGK